MYKAYQKYQPLLDNELNIEFGKERKRKVQHTRQTHFIEKNRVKNIKTKTQDKTTNRKLTEKTNTNDT